jgi:hypothetical protein
MSESLEPDSKGTVDRETRPEKHSAQTRLTFAGMQMDDRDLHPRNARASISERFESRSKLTVEGDEQRAKQDSQSL